MTIIGAAPPTGLSLAGRISSIARGIADCIKVMTDHYTAAARYEQLSRLSDAELQRRGLSRATLARSILAASSSRPNRFRLVG
jgi:hypothetical protein